MKFQNIDIKWLGHSGFLIEAGEKIIYIDPFQLNNGGEKADIILITHPHYDHCSVEDISKIVKDGTVIICPADCQSKIAKLDEGIELKIIDVGQTVEVDRIAIGGVPAYNTNKPQHPKSERWLGYLIKINGMTVYHAGDTDLTPEIGKLKGKVKIALLPVGGSFTMNFKEAAKAASIINPEVAIPMHYGSIIGSDSDAENFIKLCEKQGIRAETLEK